MHFVYLLRCGDGSLYCGTAKDPQKRLLQHNAGKGAKYTRGRLPVRIVHLEEVESLSLALSREHAIKRLTREQKLELVRSTAANRSRSGSRPRRKPSSK